MKAALYRSTGEAKDVLSLEEIDRPEPGPGDVRVRISVSGVNPTDVKARSGAVPRPIREFQVPHQDGAGVIDAVGAGVDETRIGERVWLLMAAVRPVGTAAEWTVVPAGHAVPLPDGISLDLGASLGVPAMTAYHCVFADGPVEGQTVLVSGGAGAVGHFAIELARRGGARVISTVSGPEKAELATKAGAHLVVNYTDEDAVDQIKAFAPAVDRVVEVAIGTNLGMDLELSRSGTTVVSYAAAGADPVLPVRACMSANVVLRFMLLYGVPRPALMAATRAITDALTAGDLTELPVHRFSLDGIAAAHEAQEAGVTGKVLVELA